jgi:hypothetical protein
MNPHWHQLLMAIVPVVAGASANGAQNWVKKDDVVRSFLHGVYGSAVTTIVSAVGYYSLGGGK